MDFVTASTGLISPYWMGLPIRYIQLGINGKPEIFYKNNFIAIDCGACFENGTLACLCLDTMEEFYV